MAEPSRIDNLNARDFLRRLEASAILRPAELQAASSLAEESMTGKLLARRLVARGLLTRWQAGQLLVGWTRLRLGNYKLCRQIGRGGFGRVFLAEHLQLHREVAIKTLSRRFTQRPEVVQQFLHEARQVAALDHRNLVHVLDVDAADDQYYMVMEYVLGQNLRRLVEHAGPLEVRQAISYLTQAAEGLACAHQRGIVHRDVCPENLMLDEKGTVKVLGLGVGYLTQVIVTSSADAAEDSASCRGDFRAPEQINGESEGDVSSDIYSLGVTAEYLLTGRIPGPQDDEAGGPPLPCAERLAATAMAAPLVDVIARMTAADPLRRSATLVEVAASLRAWQDGNRSLSSPVLPPPPTETPHDKSVSLNSGDADRPQQLPGAPPQAPRTTGQFMALGVLAVAVLCSAAAGFVYWIGRDAAARPPGRGRSPVQARSSTAAPAARPKLQRRASAAPSPTPQSALPAAGSGEGPPAADDSAAADAAAAPAQENEPAPAKQPAAAPPKQSTAAKPPVARPVLAGNPFQSWPDAVDLPGLDAPTTQLVLGRVALPTAADEAKLAVSLLGGDHAAGRRGRFVMSPAARAGSWEIGLAEAAGDESPPVTVGLLELAGSELVFAWQAAAESHVLSPALGNCVLRVGFERHVHDVRLRQPQRVEPLTVNLQRPAQEKTWPLAHGPDPRQVYFEVTQLDDPFPQVYNVDPVAPVVVGDDSEVLVKVGSEDLDDHLLLLQLAPELSRSFRLDCRIAFRVSPQLEPSPMTQKEYERAVQVVSTSQAGLNQQAQAKRALLAKASRNDPNRSRLEREVKQLEAALKTMSDALQYVEVLQELRAAMLNGAAVHFRVYYLAGDCEVDLLRTVGQP